MTLEELEKKYSELNCFIDGKESVISIGTISINFRTDKSFEELLSNEEFLKNLDLAFINLKHQFYIIDYDNNIIRT